MIGAMSWPPTSSTAQQSVFISAKSTEKEDNVIGRYCGENMLC
jgi:hypothetical protein